MNPIEEFYSNSTVLVTGANGFLGSVLVEKLLRCFDVKKIFVFVRSKAGKSVEERMKSFVRLEIFDQIRRENAKLFEKIVPVEVNYYSSDFNISSEMLQKIKKEVEVIFHVMASTNFNNAVNDAIRTNVLATEKIVSLAKAAESLKSLVHVSTLFSNINGYNVDEKVYPRSLSYQKFIEVGLQITDKENIIDNAICNPDKLPNTYTLTKHFTEKLVSDQASQLPAGIFRPPIVTGSYRDHPGYTDNLNGPAGLFFGVERGFIRCIFNNPDIRSNVVPVDCCINALVAIAWDVHKNFSKKSSSESNVTIYNYISSDNNLTWREMNYKVPLGIDRMTINRWQWMHFTVQTEWAFVFFNFLLHTIPAWVLDFFAYLSGQKRIYSKIVRKFKTMMIALAPFHTFEWTFGYQNTERLIEETKNFRFQRGEHNFDYRKIDWDEYFTNFIPGIKRHTAEKRN